MTLTDFVRVHLSRAPTLPGRFEFHDRELLIQGMAGERITRIGLPLEARKR